MSFESLHKPLDEVREGRRRAAIESVRPEVDGGRFPAKRVIGDSFVVRADVFGDGHDLIAAELVYRHEDDDRWTHQPMQCVAQDEWETSIRLEKLGRYQYTVRAWVERFETWRQDMGKRVDAGQNYDVDHVIGSQMIEAAAARATGRDATFLREAASDVGNRDGNLRERAERAFDPAVARLLRTYRDDAHATDYGRTLTVVSDPPKARFSAWYEFFPRSFGRTPGRHGSFADAARTMIPYVAEMGFDVIYLPPIHPIGRTHRKGPNNQERAGAEDVGSPWAIGSEAGGHKAIHPDLGTLEDFRAFREAAADHGIDVALDIAFQVSPDHPYAREHPEWFRQRPDGTIQYAENPPKKYQDIYPFDFETEQWRQMWRELESVFRFWCEQGVRIFRVDNPHTKAFGFWEWCLASIKRDYPDTVFLSEAFTRPPVMYRLAKVGFSQSYTYFTWRVTKKEICRYVEQLADEELAEYFRPNFWPNTPDILPLHLQLGRRAMFMARVALAATLSSNYGIYGPAFELMQHEPLAPGGEEYRDSEKYQLTQWDLSDPESLAPFIARLNAIRRENESLQYTSNAHFHHVDNDQILAYSKRAPGGDNIVFVFVSLDPDHPQSGEVSLDRAFLGLDDDAPLRVRDLLQDGQRLWTGRSTRVQLEPGAAAVRIYRVEDHARSERDYEYFL